MKSLGSDTTTRAALPGLALVAVLLAVFVGLGAGPRPAGAATLEPCEATQPTGPIVELDGQLRLAPTRASLRAQRRSGVRQAVIRPASNLTGRPEFPVATVAYAANRKVTLKGGVKFVRRGRAVRARALTVIAPPAQKKPVVVRGTIGRRTMNLLLVRGGKRTFSDDSGELTTVGTARLSGAAARYLNRALRIKRKKLRAGAVWGNFNLFSLYKVTEVDDPTGEVPDPPPIKSEPVGARTITGASTMKWYVRDTFVNYLATGGEGAYPADGATADPPPSGKKLSYSFNFPFASGWTVPGEGDDPESVLVKGSGTVGFRYCHNTINFTASDPEIEIDGDESSRLIFRVNGTDGTAFPNQRAVMVKLVPSRAESTDVHPNGDGTVTVTYEKIPGYIPEEATGIFAGFYFSYDQRYVTEPNNACPDSTGHDGICTEANRPDRFGFFSLTYTYPAGSS